MTPISLPEMATARLAARAAGRLILKHYRSGAVMRAKSPEETFNLVSDADLEAERAIVEIIRRQHPQHQIVAEEKQKDDIDAEHVWIVDPLDGTNNFAHALPVFAVSIAYYRGGRPYCGLVYNPVTDDWCETAAGMGAFRNGKRARVAAHAALEQSLVGVGFYYDRGKMMEATLAAIADLFRARIHGIRRFGAASLDLVNVGVGAFGGFFEYELHPWDFAAGRLFVEEAGGRVTTCTGGPPPLKKTSVLATNGLLHEAILEIVGARAKTIGE